MEQPQTPDHTDFVKSTANGPPPASAAAPNNLPPPNDDGAPAPAVPLTPLAWLSQNAVYLVAFAGIIGVLYYYQGFAGLIKAAEVVLGLGFVVFIHELGHFLAAKWCDVHVQTFSIGFGPAIPGCSFRRGETLYKLAILPLGGYVAMVGEGVEADESEEYPRSFKNKTVGQRMLIISAGVVMNMILGFICFIGVFYFHGDERLKGTVGTVEPGSPAWKAGVRSGSKITRIGNKEDPNFRDLQLKVASTWFNAKIPFEFRPPGGRPPLSVELEPRRDENDDQPVIGVGSPIKLQLPTIDFAEVFEQPVAFASSAAKARALDLAPGEMVLKASVSEPKIDLAPRSGENSVRWEDVARLVADYPTQPITLEVGHHPIVDSAQRQVTLPVDGFHFGDKIVGTTDDLRPDKIYDPFVVKALPPNPNDDPQVNADPIEFHKRMKNLAGKPVVIQVRRDGQASETPPVNILLPPSYTPTTGMVMEMGRVAAVRNDSPAAHAHVLEGDLITRIEMLTPDKGPLLRLEMSNTLSYSISLAAGVANPFIAGGFTRADPARLPFDLEDAARRFPGRKMVRFTVFRPSQNSPYTAGKDPHLDSTTVVLDPVEWDDGWDSNIEVTMKASDPLSIPQLGVAYWINCIVREVQRGSPAEKVGIQRGDRIVEIRRRTAGKSGQEENRKDKKDWTWSNWVKLESKRENGRLDPDEWAWCTQLRGSFDCPTFQVKVARGDKTVQSDDGKDKLFDLPTEYDTTWPSDNLGLTFLPDQTNVKATSVLDAVNLGLSETGDLVQHIYLGMRNLITGRVNPVKSFGGPIAIATIAFGAAEDPYKLILFLGMISINLAILNFLPIPLLDGGHMVLLTYEKIRGKPPSDAWRIRLTYLGIFVLLLLMITAFGLDIAKLFNWIRP